MSSFCPGPTKFLIGILGLDVKKYTWEGPVRVVLVVRTKRKRKYICKEEYDIIIIYEQKLSSDKKKVFTSFLTFHYSDSMNNH